MAKRDPKKAGRIRENIKKWDDNWKYNKAIYHEMTQFVMGEQWKEDEAKLFETYKKIPLTVNKIAPLMNHLLGEQQQNTPNLQCQPSEDVDERTAEVRESLVKEISLNSYTKQQYQNAFQQAVVGGFGALRVLTEYDSDDTFDQNIKISSFIDPTKCFWDLNCEIISKTDGMYSGFRTTMSRKKFRQLYGEKIERRIGTITTDISDTDMIAMSFSDENSITVIDYFERKSKMATLYQLSNGDAVRQRELDDLEEIEIDGQTMLLMNGQPVTIVDRREFPTYKVKHTKWAGDYELEETDFPSEQLPIVFVDMKSYYDKNGKQITRPFFKDARDSQRYVNYLRTQSAYLIKISRYDQFLASKENVKSNDTQQIWRDPAIVQGALIYDESPNGNKPEQLRPPELSQSLMLQYAEAAKDIQVTTGMFDTQVGEQGNEISGVAIDARTKRGSYNTYIPFNSLNHAIVCIGSIINEMIPKVYDTERMMRLDMKATGNEKIILNHEMDEYGTKTENDMTIGKYKIRLMPGASFENQKTENLQSMEMVLNKDPQSFNLIADLFVENLPMSNNIEMRNRLRTMVPPEIIEAGKTGKPLPPKQQQPDPMVMIKIEELQFKKQQAMMDAQLKQQELQHRQEELMAKAHQAGADFSVEIQKIQNQKEEAAAKAKEQELRYQAEMNRMSVDAHMSHAQNVVKILTHQPNHFKAEPQRKGNNE